MNALILEPIVSLATESVIGWELLCPDAATCTPAGWVAWYEGLPRAVAPLTCHPHLAPEAWISANADPWQLLDPTIQPPLTELARADVVIEWTEHGGCATDAEALAAATSVLDEWRHRYHTRFAVDDPGSGVDGIGRLVLLPRDIVKIDGLAMQHASEEGHALFTLQPRVVMLHSLGALVIAGWVSDHHRWRLAHAAGIQYAQGCRGPGLLAQWQSQTQFFEMSDRPAAASSPFTSRVLTSSELG